MRRTLVILISLLCAVGSSADVISYLRFEEGSGFGAADETGLMDGEVLGFTSVSPGGGDMGGSGWSTNIPTVSIPLTGESNTGSLHFGPGMVDLSNGNALSLGTAFTVEMFVMPDAPGLGYPFYGFEPISELRLNLSDSGGDLFFNTEFQGFSPGAVSADDIQIGQWQHLAMVKQPGQYSLYVDGVLLSTETLPVSTDGPYFFPSSGATGDRTIGDGFSGWIDEFRISDEALTPDQFLNHQVPEPSTTILLLIGGCLLLTDRRQRGASSD